MSGSLEGTLIAQAQHRAIVEAIANREGARAESVAREHARFARQNLETALAQPEQSELGKDLGLALIKRDRVRRTFPGSARGLEAMRPESWT
jgi:hypothetical protein